MRIKIVFCIACVLTVIMLGFTSKPDIKACCLTFKGSTTLTASPSETVNVIKPKSYTTSKGNSNVVLTEAYKFIYTNAKKGAFVTMNVEISSSKTYSKDTLAVLDNLSFQMAHGAHVQNQPLFDMNINDSRVHGFNHTNIEKDSILGRYAIFPGNNIMVLITLHNVKPELRTYKTFADYRNQSIAFIGGFTSYLRRCKLKE